MKYALITGANKGIGYETAKHLLQQGYYVFIGARNETLGNAAVQTLHEAGLNNCMLVQLDVTVQASVEAARKSIEEKTTVLDALVNNAGISGRFPKPGELLEVEEVQRVYETNVFGVVRVTNTFLPLLQQSTAPRIVNVTSDLGSMTRQNDSSAEFYHFKNTSYNPSKSALNAYTIAMAYHLKDVGIKVNAVNPGFTATDFNNHRGYRNVVDSAAVIAQYAMLPDDGVTGAYMEAEGEIPW